MLTSLVGMKSYAQDVIVTNDLRTLKVYDVDISSTFVYYQESPDAGAPTLKMPMSDVMIIKRADGTKIDPTSVKAPPLAAIKQKKMRPRILVPQEPRDYVKAVVCSDIKKKKDGLHFKAVTNDGVELKYRVLSEEAHTLEVLGIAWSKKTKRIKSLIIPETIDIEGIEYSVTQIGKEAFLQSLIQDCQFPRTLKKIGLDAFRLSNLRRILLPEGLVEIDQGAFKAAGTDPITFQKLWVDFIYIPTTVTSIGKDAFRLLGDKTSPNGYYEGRIDCLPEFVTMENCIEFGIDHNAMEDYVRRQMELSESE